MPILLLQFQKKAPVSCREAKSLVTELCSPRFVTYNTVIVLSVVLPTAANQKTLVEKVCVTHCRKEICWTCLPYEESMPFVKSKPPLPTRSRFLRGTVRSTITPVSCPSFCCNFRKKHLSHAEKQRVWSRSCALQGLLRTIQ